MSHFLRILILLIATSTLGCRYEEPTNISPINSSGRILVGDFKIGDDQAPFAHLSNHGCFRKYRGGDIVTAKLTDLWSDEEFQLSGIVPDCPSDDPYITLVLEVNKDLELKVTWETFTQYIDDRHIDRFIAQFDCVPIILQNQLITEDHSIVRMRQGIYSYWFTREIKDYTDHEVLHYGFVHKQQDSEDAIVLVSFVTPSALETTFFTLPIEKIQKNPDVTAVYISLEHEQKCARVYFLTKTPANPRIVTKQIHSSVLAIDGDFIELPIRKTDQEIRKHERRLPDPEAIK
jgi:hypothetical protein